MGIFDNRTIAAIATGMTESGIGVIRISGKDAVAIGDKLFRNPAGKKTLANAVSHMMQYGYVTDGEEKENMVDEVMAVVMKAPRSFTGEDVVEIQCHGGVLVMNKILDAALLAGAKLAEPGEFTKRAFLNGRIDLTRAEAVMDVIHSKNEYALKAGISQLQGNLFRTVKEFRSSLIYEIAFIESALDDPEHFDLTDYPEQLDEKISSLIDKMSKLADSFENGKLISEGIRTVILGKPNAGKSSLMNLFAGEDVAIVTDIAGTTRDVLKETVKFHGIGFHLIDTAGIRETNDPVERIGVERARKFAEDADLILYVVDTSVPLDENDTSIISSIKDQKCVILLNKSDLESVVSEEEISALFCDNNKNDNIVMLKISTKTGEGLEQFEEVVKDMFFGGELSMNDETVITNVRHKEALREALESLKLVCRSIEDGMPEDFFSIDLMNAYSSLGRIIGEEVDDDLVEEIFRKFCLGK